VTPADQSERIVRLEANYANMERQIASMDRKLDQLLTAADMGKGAWWLILRIGGVLAVLAGVGATIWAAVKGH
jgi:hypothetical protein